MVTYRQNVTILALHRPVFLGRKAKRRSKVGAQRILEFSPVGESCTEPLASNQPPPSFAADPVPDTTNQRLWCHHRQRLLRSGFDDAAPQPLRQSAQFVDGCLALKEWQRLDDANGEFAAVIAVPVLHAQ